MTDAQFVYPLEDLKQGPLNIDVEIPNAWLNEHLADADVIPSERSQGSVRCSLVLTGRDIVVRGDVSALIFVPCARCLGPAEVKVRGRLALFLQPASSTNRRSGASDDTEHDRASRKRRREQQDVEFSSEEAELDVYEGEQVVLDGFIREAILLEVPIFPLCSESCEGIDAGPDRVSDKDAFEEQRGIDPRLAPLLKLKKSGLK